MVSCLRGTADVTSGISILDVAGGVIGAVIGAVRGDSSEPVVVANDLGGAPAALPRFIVGAGGGGGESAGAPPGLAPGALRVTRTVSFLKGTAEVFLIGCVADGSVDC
jgi:hypothetical protein